MSLSSPQHRGSGVSRWPALGCLSEKDPERVTAVPFMTLGSQAGCVLSTVQPSVCLSGSQVLPGMGEGRYFLPRSTVSTGPTYDVRN